MHFKQTEQEIQYWHRTHMDVMQRELICQPSIIISKLSSCTVIEDNRSHISMKIATLNPNKVSIFNMKATQYRGIASFKLLSQTEYCNSVLDKSIWQKNALVKELISRGRNPVKNSAVEHDNGVPSNKIRLPKDMVLSDNVPVAKTNPIRGYTLRDEGL
ncbi:hypothetical protein GQX74_009599 [Glossina fuscipes]|nr:hypothetical protein GQX74_009599 [Glossina fuscipes]